jgi:hypothetical protein
MQEVRNTLEISEMSCGFVHKWGIWYVKGSWTIGEDEKIIVFGFFFYKTIFHMLITYCFSRDVSIGVAWRHAIYAELAGVWLLWSELFVIAQGISGMHILLLTPQWEKCAALGMYHDVLQKKVLILDQTSEWSKWSLWDITFRLQEYLSHYPLVN